MKKLLPICITMMLLTSCNGWFFQPSPYTPPTPFLPPTNTPSIVSPTPVIIGVSSPTPVVATATAPGGIPVTGTTNTPMVVASDTPSVTASVTVSASNPSVSVEVLGCDTSIDVMHSMGEVTNAYITLKNVGNVDLTNIKATLHALDEGREHPDKTVELTVLPVNYQVSIKLTVDSTYREETAIQIEVTGDYGLFQRVDANSCRDIGLFAPKPESLMTPVPSNP